MKLAARSSRQMAGSSNIFVATAARSGAISAADSVSPPGRPTTILSGASSVCTSSAFIWMATPCDDFRNANSTKLCCLMKPRAGGLPVTTRTDIAGVGIDQPVHAARLVEQHRDAGAGRIGDVAQRRQGLRRRGGDIGGVHHPRGSVAGDAHQLRAIEPHAHRLPARQRNAQRVAHDRAAVARDLADVERDFAVEDHPQRIRADEHSGRRRRANGTSAAAPRCSGER